jgi:hypothetical protein
MNHDDPAPESASLESVEIVDFVNARYRREKIEDAFFVTGVVSAVVSSFLRWPFYVPLAAAVSFAAWTVSFIIYSELYRFLSARTLSEVLGRMGTDRKQIKCIFLFCLPVILRFARLLVRAALTR